MRGWMIIGLIFVCAVVCGAAEMNIKFADGTTVKGELTAPSESGVVVKVDGKLRPRTPWTRFSQETLIELQKDEKFRQFVDLLVVPQVDDAQLEAAAKAASTPKKINVKAVNHPSRITPRPGIIAGIFTPLGFVVFLVFWLTNIYAGYEVGIFRRFDVKKVCGISAVAPIVGPVVFLCMKTREREAQRPASIVANEAPDEVSEPGEGSATPAEVEAPPIVETPKLPATVSFKRGEFTFNRRFIETKFSGFMRLVPGEAEKDLVLYFSTARGEHKGKRISKVTQTDLQLVIQKEEAFAEVTIPFNDILEIQVRHKDAA
jgi:hypothetical protein